MGDAENALPPSKKRAARRELSRDTPLDDEEDTPEPESGTFKRASDEVLASRRIVKVRRQQTNSAQSTNPFSGIRLVSSTESSANPPAEATPKSQLADENTVADDTKGCEGITKDYEKAKDGDSNKPESKTEEVTDKSAANEDAAKESALNKEHTAEERVGEKSEVEEEQGKDGDKNENEAGEVDKEQAKDDNNTGNDDKKAEDGANEESVGEVDKEQTKDENSTGNDNKKQNTGSEDKEDNKALSEEASAEGSALKSFQQLSSSQNAFTGLAGTGFSAPSFTFGSLSNDGSASGSAGSIFRVKTDKPLGLGLSNNGNSVFGVTGASSASKGEGSGFSTMQEVVVETGEENEKMVFSADSVLFEYAGGSWKERGKGELKINVTTGETEKARLLMRSRGNYRLILNARLYPDMKLTNMEKKGVTFACINSSTDGKDGLSTFALKFKDGSIVEEFKATVMAHKGEKTTVLKTPENSPKASDD